MLPLLALLVDSAGTVVILAVALSVLRDYLGRNATPHTVDALHLRLAQGLVLALSFKTGAGIIRTATVTDLSHLKTLAAIIALRFFLGRALKGQLARRRTALG